VLAYIIGIVLFALGIGISVALHEAGHMWTAKLFGMKVRRYFIGFGPRIFSFHRGETEFGLKAIPAGGFCDIAGMTALDEVTEDEAPRAMWRYQTWKRFVVMSAGSVTHFIVGFIILYFMAVSIGLPNISRAPVIKKVEPCAQSVVKVAKDSVAPVPCGPNSRAPAKEAHLHAGDTFVSVAGKPTPTWSDLVRIVQHQRGSTPVTVLRDGQRLHTMLDVATVTSVPASVQHAPGPPKLAEVGAIGVQYAAVFDYNAASAFGGAGYFTGQMFANAWEGIKLLPQKIPALVQAITGGHRDANTPISVVGASRIGGQAVEQGLWMLFWLLLALLNFAIGVINLLPLLPLDGGHIAVVLYEKVRDWLRRLRGKAAGHPVDYTKLAPFTMIVIVIGGAYMLLTVTADIVNPITIGGQ
jgi:membrane-associated protease RseP (regulator of RpoE activity)